MNTPPSNSPLYLFLDPDPAYITLNGTSAATSTAGVAGTLQVTSVLNRAGITGVIAPDSSTTSTQPTWSKIGLITPFETWDWPGSYYYSGTGSVASPATTGTSGFVFTGTQYLSCDSIASSFSGTAVGITVVCVVQNGTSGTGTVWSLGGQGASGTSLELIYTTATNLRLIDNASGQHADITVTAGTVYVVTAARSSSGLVLRAQISTATTIPPTATSAEINLIAANQTTFTPTAATYSVFTIGALNTGTTASPTVSTSPFTGNIGQLLVFGIDAGQTILTGASLAAAVNLPCADILRVEADLLLEAGITLGDTNVTYSTNNAS